MADSLDSVRDQNSKTPEKEPMTTNGYVAGVTYLKSLCEPQMFSMLISANLQIASFSFAACKLINKIKTTSTEYGKRFSFMIKNLTLS